MADKNDRAIQHGEGPLRERDIIGQRNGRILDNRDTLASPSQDVVDALPAGSIRKTAVNEDDVLHVIGCVCV